MFRWNTKGGDEKKSTKIYYWLQVTEAKDKIAELGKELQQGTEIPTGRTRPDPKRIKELKENAGAFIEMDEINSYYFETSAERADFLNVINGHLKGPSPVGKKDVPTERSTTADEVILTEELKLIQNASKRHEDDEAGKTLELGVANRDTEIDLSTLPYAYMFAIENGKWSLKKKTPDEIRLVKGARPEVPEGQNSDFARANSGELRSKELMTIYFRHRVDANRVFTAYIEKAKLRR
jgi:hypothetical protein